MICQQEWESLAEEMKWRKTKVNEDFDHHWLFYSSLTSFTETVCSLCRYQTVVNNFSLILPELICGWISLLFFSLVSWNDNLLVVYLVVYFSLKMN